MKLRLVAYYKQVNYYKIHFVTISTTVVVP